MIAFMHTPLWRALIVLSLTLLMKLSAQAQPSNNNFASGWVITGTMLFGGAATILGNRHYVRNIVIGAVLSLISFYAFYSGLGIPLPAGILDGIL